MNLEKVNITFYSEQQPDYTVQRRQLNGRNYAVVPVIMMVEGVHSGSGGAILHLEENFSQNPDDWNNVPLTAGHPQNNEGNYISANDAQRDLWIVGHVDNAHVVDGKLKAEAWIDVQRAIAVNPEIMNYLDEGKPLDVSTGAMTYDIKKEGQWNDESYQAITEVYAPDHLALLPGDRGACSWSDGCGIRNNKEEESNEMNPMKEDIKKGIGVFNGLQANEIGYVELSSKIQTMLDRRDSEAQMFFLKEVYDDYFVYEVRDRDQGKQTFYRQDYSYSESGDQINLDEARQEVRRSVSYQPVQNNAQENEETSDNGGCGCSMKRTKFNTNQNQKEDNNMSDSKDKQPSGEVMEKVVSLVNNERTRFTKSDRDWLLQMNESQLDRLEPTEAPAPEVTREQALQALSEDFSDADKLLEIVDGSVKDKIRNGIKAYEATREKLIKTIQANTGDIWTEEKLKSMDTETLQSLEKSTRKVDYSGQGGTEVQTNSVEEDDDFMLPAGVELQS